MSKSIGSKGSVEAENSTFFVIVPANSNEQNSFHSQKYDAAEKCTLSSREYYLNNGRIRRNKYNEAKRSLIETKESNSFRFSSKFTAGDIVT